jgi:hypothetical protein
MKYQQKFSQLRINFAKLCDKLKIWRIFAEIRIAKVRNRPSVSLAWLDRRQSRQCGPEPTVAPIAGQAVPCYQQFRHPAGT